MLTLANHNYQGDSVPDEFAAAVERLSDGSIDIKVRYGFRYYDIDERGTIAACRSGAVDAAVVGARAWDTVGVTSFQVLVAPFLVDSYALERRVLESELVDRMLEGLEPLGLVGLAILPGEMRRPLGTSRALLRPKDYEDAPSESAHPHSRERRSRPSAEEPRNSLRTKAGWPDSMERSREWRRSKATPTTKAPGDSPRMSCSGRE